MKTRLMTAIFGVNLVLSVLLGPAMLAASEPRPRPPRLVGPDGVPEGLAARDWAVIRRQLERQRHSAVAVEGGHQARNPGQQWLTRFDGRGFLTQPDADGWEWGLELRSYGFAGQPRPVTGPRRVKATGQRVSYDWDDTLQEWFVNDARGLEHGFTIRERPSAPEPGSSRGHKVPFSSDETGESLLPPAPASLSSQPSTLDLLLAVRGGLWPEVQADGRGVHFVQADGGVALTYTGLTVYDADGRLLPSRFEAVSGHHRGKSAQPCVGMDLGRDPAAVTDGPRETGAVLRLVIEECGARYPLTVDPTAQQAYLKASNTGAGDMFGYSVAVSGDTVVVGAYREASAATGVNGNQSSNSAPDSGAAYVFVRNGGAWTQQAYLKASNTGASDYFGHSVAVSGDTVLVGAYLEDSGAKGVNGNQSDNSAIDSGATYIFVRNGRTWTQQAYLKASNTGANDLFGWSVAISGNIVVVGAYGEASDATGVNGNQSSKSAANSGAAYVFVRTGTTWFQQAYLKASNTGTGDNFGFSVAVSGWNVVVGALREDSNATGVNGNQSNNSASNAGAAYVFVNRGVWLQQAYLKASNTGASDLFGWSVAMSGDTVAIGASGESSNAKGVNGNQSNNSAADAGAAYVFVRDGMTWSQQAYLKAANTEANDLFGRSVAVSDKIVVVGARWEDSNAIGVNGNRLNNSATNSGAAYVFVRNGTTWNQQAYLKASNTGTTDWFGHSVAVSGDTVVIGAPQENGAATGVNGDQGDNGAGDSGAAYVIDLFAVPEFTQQAYLKASNTDAEDDFGMSVAVSGDTMVVGAPGESSRARGVNGDQSDNGARAHGAAYVFVRNGMTWTWSQQAYLKPSNTELAFDFGSSVAIAGDTVVVGASREAGNGFSVNSGAAYVFVRNGTTWSQQAYLKASNAAAGDEFGGSVAISGDTVVVGAYREKSNATGVNGNQNDNNATDSGAAYVFLRHGTIWSQQAYLKASNTGAGDDFGSSVAIFGDTVVIGAQLEDSAATSMNGNQNDNSADSAGAAYVFVRNGTTWTQHAYLKASNAKAHSGFGYSVAVSRDTVVVGAVSEDSPTTELESDPAGWMPGSGAAYVFVRSGTAWNPQAFLKASNLGVNHHFGCAVAVSGDTVVVGARGESSSARSVNGNQNDNSALGAGAAYVFVRSGTAWSQQVYLKASNTGAADAFGSSVAMSGDTVVVGADREDSNATGVNGNEGDNSAQEAGAAYVFASVGLVTRLTIWPDGSGGFFFNCTGFPGSRYRLLRAGNLSGPWATIAEATVPPSGVILEFQDTSPLPGRAFYRAVQP